MLIEDLLEDFMMGYEFKSLQDIITAWSSTPINIDVASHKETMYPALKSTPFTIERLDLACAFHRIQCCLIAGTFAADGDRCRFQWRIHCFFVAGNIHIKHVHFTVFNAV